MGAASKIDWDRIEPGWRSGKLSVLQLASLYEEETKQSVSHTAINKHFRKLGIPRDLSEKVNSKADAMVAAAMVSGKVSAETTASDAEIINRAAIDIASVRLSHRNDLARGRSVVAGLLEELEKQCGPENAALLEQMGDMMRSPDSSGVDKLNDLYFKVISLPGRAKTMKDLAESLSKLIDKERQAFGIDKGSADEDKPLSLSDAQRASRIAFLIEKARGNN